MLTAVVWKVMGRGGMVIAIPRNLLYVKYHCNVNIFFQE